MDEARSNRRTRLIILASGLLAVGIAVVTIFESGASPTTYTATAQIALVPGKQLPDGDVAAYTATAASGQAGRVTAVVLNQEQWRNAAAAAVGVSPESMTVVASAVDGTNIVAVTAESSSAVAAERGLSTIITDAAPLVRSVAGPYEVTVVQEPAGTAVPTR